MEKRFKSVPFIAAVILAVSLPAGFAVAQITSQPEAEQPPMDHLDPDPSTDALEIGAAFERAMESGDQAAIDRAADAVREEWLSRLGPEEKAGAENAPPEPEVPPGTYAYVNDAISASQVESCRDLLRQSRGDALCELIVLYGEGKIAAGPYTLDEVREILRDKKSSLSLGGLARP